MIWHILDVRAVWIKEFASALSQEVPVLGWLPQFSSASLIHNREEEFACADPPLRIRSFPLQRGFARFPLTVLAQEKRRINRRLRQRSSSPPNSPLVCTAPHYADVAAEWPGPVIYYVTDFFPAYRNEPEFIRALDRRMCQSATLVCPNSARIADYLNREAGCPKDRIAIVPNATRGANLLDRASTTPADLPEAIAGLPRPVAGVIGNLAENTDWRLLRETIDRTPWLSWAFVGPTQMQISDRDQDEAREWLMCSRGHVRFVGEQPYGRLKDYARSFDVAVMPYRKREPTYSGSSTRFYEHLAACRPMIATRGFEELLQKEPLLSLIDNSAELVAMLDRLRAQNFRDGYEEARWEASRDQTWESRAAQMVAALHDRIALSHGAAA